MLQQKLKKIRDLKKKARGTFKRNYIGIISVTVKKDNSVKELIEKAKEEFYTKYSYLKPECEKNGLEKVCDGLKSAGSWLVDNIKEILVVGLAVLAVVAVVALAIATFGLGAVAIAALVGVAAGLASQLITDIASGFVTGKFKFSSIQEYMASAVGGSNWRNYNVTNRWCCWCFSIC